MGDDKPSYEDLEQENDRLREHAQDLETTVRELGRLKTIRDSSFMMVAGMAHDLTNSLVCILGGSELALRDIEECRYESLTDYIMMVKGTTQKINEMLSMLVTFSQRGRIGQGNLETCYIAETLDEGLKLIEDKYPLVKISREYSEDLLPVNIDKDLISQACLNLYLNGIDAMDEKGVLQIRANNYNGRPGLLPKGDYVLVEIEDSGKGIPRELLNKIFDPFFTTKDEEKGSGLGLAISYETIKDHRGDLRVESEVGKGSTFSIYLPAHKESS
jgi:two-component system cell cycle sensor histidine kinase/response regulator CckA